MFANSLQKFCLIKRELFWKKKPPQHVWESECYPEFKYFRQIRQLSSISAEYRKGRNCRRCQNCRFTAISAGLPELELRHFRNTIFRHFWQSDEIPEISPFGIFGHFGRICRKYRHVPIMPNLSKIFRFWICMRNQVRNNEAKVTKWLWTHSVTASHLCRVNITPKGGMAREGTSMLRSSRLAWVISTQFHTSVLLWKQCKNELS